jgi:hypothetical protein
MVIAGSMPYGGVRDRRPDLRGSSPASNERAEAFGLANRRVEFYSLLV